MMRRLFIAWLCACTVAVAQVRFVRGLERTSSDEKAPANDSNPRLYWKNQESVSGELREATATDLSWQSPLFEEPLRLRWDAIRRIEQALPSKASTDPFGVVLRDGSFLLGELAGVSADTVSLKSARHGEIALKRSEVLRIIRLRGEKIVAAGPAGDVGWKKEEKNGPNEPGTPKMPRLAGGAGGALEMPYWNTKATLDIKTPEQIEFEFDLRSSQFPSFSLRFDGDSSKGVCVETWDDELVVSLGKEFESVRQIGEKERELSLRVFWDRTAKKVLVCTASGEKLIERQFKGDLGKSPGWSLQNKGRDLTLTHFRVRRWDGNPPEKFDPARLRVHKTDGHVVEGSVAEISDNLVKMSATSDAAAPSFFVEDLAEIVFDTAEPKVDEAIPILAFADGTLCHGRIASVANGRALLETSFATTALPVSMDGLRELKPCENKREGGDEKPELPADEIVVDSTKLHGTLTSSGDGRLHFLPAGGVAPSVLRGSATVKVTRTLQPDAAPPARVDLFYTSFGDIVPASFRGIDGAEVEIESDIVEAKKLQVAYLDAVQFGAVTQAGMQGFDAPGWHLLKGNDALVKVSKDTLELKPGAVFGHPLAMQCDEFQVSFSPLDCLSFRMRLFCGSGPSERGVSILFVPQGGSVFVGSENEENEFSNRAAIGTGPAVARVEIKATNVHVYIGEQLVLQTVVDPKRRGGTGLTIEPVTSFGEMGPTVKLTNFSSKIAPGSTLLPEIDPETKAQALTVPRFRKARPPKQALVATNGDVLRGEIEASTATHFSFLSGMEKLRIPRARVNAAIWLKPPLKDAAASKDAAVPTEELLNRPFNRNVRYGGATLTTLLAVLSREAPGLKFNNRVPTQNRRSVSMSFGRQSVREALDQLCVSFDVRYHVEEDGTVTVEPRSAATENIAEKAYWLKADAFPDRAAGQAWLVKQGIEFPNGTAAVWNATTRQLEVRQRAAAFDKIEEALKKEFGVGPAPLTHWVLLANGARLGLSVEKFEKDFIIGHHPEYGRCRIPMPLVVSIQTNKPGATLAMRSVADWNLVSAREPVIPEGGGDNSPSLGKEAAPFKIPFLAGGDFDLKAERGKIVVLDFWATWCAPCVQSLPGLIDTVATFPKDRVRLVGINQSEPADAVKRFIETRQWNLTVAMDVDQKIAQQYGVTGIPHTVIVGPDGKIAWVKTGASGDNGAEAGEAIKKLLDAAPADTTAPKSE